MKAVAHIPFKLTPLDNFTCKVVGTTFEGREALLPGRKIGEVLVLLREPQNQYDVNAVAVYSAGGQIGYVGKTMAHLLAPHIDAGEKWEAVIKNILGGAGLGNLGIELLVYRIQEETAFIPDHFGETA
jgi:hypothetical protein